MKREPQKTWILNESQKMVLWGYWSTGVKPSWVEGRWDGCLSWSEYAPEPELATLSHLFFDGSITAQDYDKLKAKKLIPHQLLPDLERWAKNNKPPVIQPARRIIEPIPKSEPIPKAPKVKKRKTRKKTPKPDPKTLGRLIHCRAYKMNRELGRASLNEDGSTWTAVEYEGVREKNKAVLSNSTAVERWLKRISGVSRLKWGREIVD